MITRGDLIPIKQMVEQMEINYDTFRLKTTNPELDKYIIKLGSRFFIHKRLKYKFINDFHKIFGHLM